ncbi:hypothetical protein R1flu_022401 [Riccia fluitans]|uniref:Uncharacterized protein n=1 Tax=Riccia fluitans TaxID=41844 RepID=A0ABD1ZS98_9MARC
MSCCKDHAVDSTFRIGPSSRFRSVCREEPEAAELRRAGGAWILHKQMGSIDEERTGSNDDHRSANIMDDKSRSKRSHFLSRSFSRGSFSWSFVRSALNHGRNGATSTSSSGSCGYDDARSTDSNLTSSSNSSNSDSCADASSSSSSGSPTASSLRSHLRRSLWSFVKKKGASEHRKPVLLEKIPFGKSSEYLTVYVGPRIEQSVKYVISRKLLTHPLFQVLFKCSEDEFGEDFSVDKGVALVCDSALFLQVVRAVDDSMWSALTAVCQDDEHDNENGPGVA